MNIIRSISFGIALTILFVGTIFLMAALEAMMTVEKPCRDYWSSATQIQYRCPTPVTLQETHDA